ncbi:MAG: hypothetical protein NZ581_05160 [Candidatus Caldarchaeum sp.]|nr:hypothetical protein [Candidatus Caldarchaeum sp.]MDW8435568.1 hypothetical protein [Candidatus Caldarchaeum sp.]
MGVDVKLASLVVNEIMLDIYCVVDGVLLAGEDTAEKPSHHPFGEEAGAFEGGSARAFSGAGCQSAVFCMGSSEVAEDVWILTPSREVSPPPQVSR